MEICEFKIAKKLKEKGFREPCLLYYNSDKVRIWFKEPWIAKNFTPTTLGNDDVLAPTISQVLKWLREKDIMVEIPIDLGDNGIWQFTFRIQTKEFYERATKCDYVSYESAALSCIEYVIDNLI